MWVPDEPGLSPRVHISRSTYDRCAALGLETMNRRGLAVIKLNLRKTRSIVFDEGLEVSLDCGDCRRRCRTVAFAGQGQLGRCSSGHPFGTLIRVVQSGATATHEFDYPYQSFVDAKYPDERRHGRLGGDEAGNAIQQSGSPQRFPILMYLYLVHHGDAVAPEVDPGRPLSTQGLEAANRLAAEAAARAAKPAVVWHSGKLRARQTAKAFWSACNPRAEFAAARDLSPDDPPSSLRDRLRGETRDILIAGHFPHLPRLLTLLLGGAAAAPAAFPLHGVVALESLDEGETWVERWRLGPAS